MGHYQFGHTSGHLVLAASIATRSVGKAGAVGFGRNLPRAPSAIAPASSAPSFGLPP